MIKLARLLKINEEKESGGPDFLWKALEELAPALGDVLAVDQETKPENDVAQALTVFRHRDLGQTECYALVTRQGQVLVGRTDRLTQRERLHLTDYDPLWHHVVTLLVTKRYRLLGDRLDIWVVVRRFAPDSEDAPESVVYHGLVWIDSQGRPHVVPSQDEQVTNKAGEWLVQPAQGLPAWQLRDDFSFATGVEDFPTQPPDAEDFLNGRYELAVCGAQSVCLSTIDGVMLKPLRDKGQIRSLDLRDRVRCLTFADRQPRGPHGVAGCDDRRLIAFPRVGDELDVCWLQLLPEVPLAIGFLGTAPWPDLLVGLGDGRLMRLRFIGNDIRELWRACWEHLGLAVADARIDWLQQHTSHDLPVARRRAAVLGMLHGVLEPAYKPTSEQMRYWLDAVPKLFPRREKEVAIPEASKTLVRFLGRFARDPESRGPVYDQEGHFLPALVLRIYEQQLDVTDRERIDDTVRAIQWPDELCDYYVDKLQSRARRTPAAICREPEPERQADLENRAVFELQRWMNAYLPSDSVGLPRPSPGRGLVSVVGLRQGHGGACLAIAYRDRVQFHEIDKNGCFEREHPESFQTSGLKTVLRVPGRTDRLLFIGVEGRLELYDPGGSTRIFKEFPLPLEGHLVASACPGGLDRALVALVVSCQHRSLLVPCWIDDQEIAFRKIQPLGLTEDVHAIDLAQDGEGGYRLLVGTARSGPARIYRLDSKAEVQDKHWLRVLERGCLAVRLTETYGVAGAQNGLVCCTELSYGKEYPRLRWTYHMDGAIRGICDIRLGDEPHLLVGAESGELCLFRACDGRRVWKHRLEDPIRYLGTVKGLAPMALALTRGDTLALFEQVAPDEAEAALKEAKRYIERLPAPPDPKPNTDSISAFYRLLRLGDEPLKVLRQHDRRETRAQLLRYLACKIEVQPTAIVGELSFRELTLLMSYLPEWTLEWDEAISTELRRRPWGRELREHKAGETAVATYLRWLGLQKPRVDRLTENPVPEVYLGSSRWIRLAFARLLAEAVQREIGATDAGSSVMFLPLLRHLFCLPTPELAESLAQVCPYDSPLQKDFRAFAWLLRCACDRADVPADVLHHIARCLDSGAQEDRDDWTRLLSAVVPLLLMVAENEGRGWSEWRIEALDALRVAAKVAYSELRPGSSAQGMVKRTREGLLVSMPALPDEERLEDRINRIDRAVKHLEVKRDSGPDRRERPNPWLKYYQGLFDLTRAAIRRILHEEGVFLLNLVRPRISVESQHMDESNRLELTLKVEGEGMRQLHDVSIQIDASGEGGLRGQGTLKLDQPIAHLHYPDRFTEDKVMLTGYVRPDQRHVTLRAQVNDDADYEYEEQWVCSVEASAPERPHSLTIPSALPLCYRAFSEAVRSSDSLVTLAVLDGDLGRERFIQDWNRTWLGRRIDLDTALRDTGPGRRYSARSLDIALIEQHIGAEAKSQESGGNGQLLVAPCDEVVQRLEDGESPGVLQAWGQRLRERSAEQGCLVLLVSSRHACRLRSLGLGGLREVAAHRVLFNNKLREPSTDQLWSEVIGLVMDRTQAQRDMARSWVDALGADLRLLLRWLRSAERPSRTGPAAIVDFLDEEAQHVLLLEELRALDAYDAINLLVGADTVTRLERHRVAPEHVAHEDCFSTTRKSTNRPKRLQSAGMPFTANSLEQIGEDLHPPSHLSVQGFGVGTAAMQGRTRLLAIAQYRGTERREPSFRRLKQWGLGRLIQGIYRTASPYRELILELYESHGDEPENLRDGAVYADIMGRDRSLADAMSPAELGELSMDALKSLLPGAKDEALRRLYRLAGLWRGDPNIAEVSRAVSYILTPKPVINLNANPRAYIRPLLELSLSCFGVGESSEALKTDRSYAKTHMLWVPQDAQIEIRRISRAVTEAEERLKQADTSAVGFESSRGLRVFLMGPGADGLEQDPARRVAVLRLADICQAAWEGDLSAGLDRKARAQLRLSAYSPFQTSGGLPPGSRLFRGRERELDFIQRRVRTASILVVGGRQVGKTSLLNQVAYWAHQEADLEPICLELQGVRSREEFLDRLISLKEDRYLAEETRGYLEKTNVNSRNDAYGLLCGLANTVRRIGRIPLFLFNEVDRLFEQDQGLVEIWRGMNDAALARFVMVGYSVIGRLSTLGNPDSPFFHFTVGTDFGGKAISLGALSASAAESLLELLEAEPLGLRWMDQAQKIEALKTLLEHSYCIPWILQRYGQLLVERMEEGRRDRIAYEDVLSMLSHEGDVVWQYMQGIDYRSLGYPNDRKYRVGLELVLYSLVRSRYFRGGQDAQIRDPRIRERRALDLGFTVDEARSIVEETISGLLVQREYEVFQDWFDELDLEEAFRRLTLTLALEPDPDSSGRYGFLLHIVPLELYTQCKRDELTLDNLIIQQAVQLLDTVEHAFV